MASPIQNQLASAATQVVNSPLQNAAGAGPGGYLSNQKDAQESSTEAKFGEVLSKIQSQYGARPEKAREIKKTLGKDDFLRIMMTQMKNQDPTNPFKPDQMAQEMAQFTSVEQLQNVNQNLAKMTNQNQPLERMAMTNMIGKIVTVDRERFPHADGHNESLAFSLPGNATNVKVAIVSADSGETVAEEDLGPQKAGEGNFNWNGLKGNTLPAKAGTYMFKVAATDEKGVPMQINTRGQARVVGLSFEGQEPVFLIGDAKNQSKITMKNIIKIEDGGLQMMAPQAMAAPQGEAAGSAGGVPGAAANTPNFISFKKGEGSSNTPPEVAAQLAQALANRKAQEAIANAGGTPEEGESVAKAQFQPQPQQQARAPQQAERPAYHPMPQEKGFPNGLSGG